MSIGGQWSIDAGSPSAASPQTWSKCQWVRKILSSLLIASLSSWFSMSGLASMSTVSFPSNAADALVRRCPGFFLAASHTSHVQWNEGSCKAALVPRNTSSRLMDPSYRIGVKLRKEYGGEILFHLISRPRNNVWKSLPRLARAL